MVTSAPLPEGPLAVAVSGGADSFALLHLAHTRGVSVTAFTVDHGLRKASAHEAQLVADWCAHRNIPHQTLHWAKGDGEEKAGPALQARARTARYRLLYQACRERNISTLLTGHTADDQAETVFMRLRRGQAGGLGGMRARRRITVGLGEPIWLERPLLAFRRAELRAYATQAGLAFIDDPSNDDMAFERVQLRALLAALEQQSLVTVPSLCDLAARAQQDHASRQAMLSDLAARHVEELPDGAVRIFGLTDEMLISTLVGVVRDALGDSYRRGSPAQLAGRSGTTTEGGVLIHRAEETGDVIVAREPSAVLGRRDGKTGVQPLPVAAGEEIIYDNRLILQVPQETIGPDAHIMPIGRMLSQDIVKSTISRIRVASLPCLVAGGRVTHLPAGAADLIEKAFTGWKGGEDFLVSNDMLFESRSLFAERFAGDVIRY